MDKEYRPDEWYNNYLAAYESTKDTQPEFAIQAGMQGLAYEAGADDMLRLLEPLIRDKAPSSSLVDIMYGGNDDES